MLANQIEVSRQSAILVAQPGIDAAIFHRAEDSSRESRLRKKIEHVAVVEMVYRTLALGSVCAAFHQVSIERESIAQVNVCRRPKVPQLR